MVHLISRKKDFPMPDFAWKTCVRLINAAGTRILGKDFDELMSTGCRIVRQIPSGISLTFDDGPNPLSTPRILDALEACNAFIDGRQYDLPAETTRGSMVAERPRRSK